MAKLKNWFLKKIYGECPICGNPLVPNTGWGRNECPNINCHYYSKWF